VALAVVALGHRRSSSSPRVAALPPSVVGPPEELPLTDRGSAAAPAPLAAAEAAVALDDLIDEAVVRPATSSLL
jgi:hypothetical protein